MTMYQVQIPFKTRAGEVTQGQIITMAENRARPLLEAGKITEIRACHICHTFSWWFSINRVLVCGVCHPPASEGLVKRWIRGENS